MCFRISGIKVLLWVVIILTILAPPVVAIYLEGKLQLSTGVAYLISYGTVFVIDYLILLLMDKHEKRKNRK